jgi:hypothetical protein
VKYKGVRLTVCLLALCVTVPENSRRIYRHVVVRDRFLSFDGNGDDKRTDAGFVPNAERYKPEQDSAARSARSGVWVVARAKQDLALVFSSDPETWFAGNVEWSRVGNKLWEGFYVNPYGANDATTGGNLSIDYYPQSAPPMGWSANITPSSSGNSGQYQIGGIGGSYPNSLPAHSSNPTNSAFQLNAPAGNGGSETANLSTSNGLDQALESVRSATQMASAVTDGNSGLLSAAAMNAVIHAYQAAAGQVSADSAPSQSNSGEPGPKASVSGKPVVTTAASSSNSASAPTSSNSTSGSWSSNSTGSDFQSADDSALQPTEKGFVNQVWTPSAGWSVAPVDGTGDSQDQSDVALQGSPTNGSVSQSPLDPVPEPSQIVLMFTVIALVALAVKRSAVTRRAALRPNGWTS